MEITREALEARKAELAARRDDLLGNANACQGGVLEIDYWLQVLEATEGEQQQPEGHPIAPTAAEISQDE